MHEKSQVNWYGGNQQFYQYYPIQNMIHKGLEYLPKEYNNTGVAERYWLNSNGIFFKVNNDAPLFLDQNNDRIGFLCFRVKRASPYDINEFTFDFGYHVGIGKNAREVHMKAVTRFFGKPSGHPSQKLVERPFWSPIAVYTVNKMFA